jgi:hypothetical protein
MVDKKQLEAQRGAASREFIHNASTEYMLEQLRNNSFLHL